MTDDEDRGARAAAERELKRHSRVEELEAKVVELERRVPLLTERLEQRTAALDRVVAEKEAFREALVRILELEGERIPTGGDDLTDPMLPVEAVHDAVGHDLIGYLMYRQRWIVGVSKREGDTLPLDWDEARHGKIFWRDPTRRSAVQHAEALEKLRREGMFKPFEKADLGPYLDAIDEHVAELSRLNEEPVGEAFDRALDNLYVSPTQRGVPVDMPEPLPRCSCMHGFDGADGPKIVRRDAACPIHGHDQGTEACPTCVSTNPAQRNCRLCKDDCGSSTICDDRWHDR